MSALPCSCCIGLVCPCVLYGNKTHCSDCNSSSTLISLCLTGQIIERINIGSCCATAALCVVCAPCAGWNGARSRQVMVNKYSGQGVELEFGSFHVELCCWCFCAPCSICQANSSSPLLDRMACDGGVSSPSCRNTAPSCLTWTSTAIGSPRSTSGTRLSWQPPHRSKPLPRTPTRQRSTPRWSCKV